MKKNEIILLDLFSGIGGFAKGLTDAGFVITKHYFSEIDKHAIANYKYNFPDAEYIGSVTDVREPGLERPNIITFGSPCQDFSLAGKRLGMEGERSNLILHAIRLITECRPDVYIWENVKGAYSSNGGADYWAIIQAFANLDGYRHEQQLLNTAWFLPQNRERIYSIGHLTGRSEPRVFPIGEDFTGDYERTAETAVVRTISAGGHSGGHHSGMTLVKSATKSGYEIAETGDSINYSVPNSQTRRGRVGKQVAQTLDTASNQAVIVAMRGRNPEKPTSRESGLPTEQMLEPNLTGNTNCLTGVQKDNLVFITEHRRQSEEVRVYEENSPTLCSKMGTGGGNIPFVNNIRRLTEIECERLQGFPDNWTEYGIYKKQVWINKKEGTFKIIEGKYKIPKTQRYKMCGNAVSTVVVKAIGLKLLNT